MKEVRTDIVILGKRLYAYVDEHGHTVCQIFK